MNACAWCGATGEVAHTRIPADAPTGQERILLCLNRVACRQRMTEQTNQQLTGARP